MLGHRQISLMLLVIIHSLMFLASVLSIIPEIWGQNFDSSRIGELIGEGVQAYALNLKEKQGKRKMVLRIHMTADNISANHEIMHPPVFMRLLNLHFVGQIDKNSDHNLVKTILNKLEHEHVNSKMKQMGEDEYYNITYEMGLRASHIPELVFKVNTPLYFHKIRIDESIVNISRVEKGYGYFGRRHNHSRFPFPFYFNLEVTPFYGFVVKNMSEVIKDDKRITEHSILKLFYGWYNDQTMFMKYFNASNSDSHTENIFYHVHSPGKISYIWSDFCFDEEHILYTEVWHWESELILFCKNLFTTRPSSHFESLIDTIAENVLPFHKNSTDEQYFGRIMPYINKALSLALSSNDLKIMLPKKHQLNNSSLNS